MRDAGEMTGESGGGLITSDWGQGKAFVVLGLALGLDTR